MTFNQFSLDPRIQKGINKAGYITPTSIQEKAMEWKDDPDISMEEWAEKLHKYYADDKTEELQQEFEELIEEWS